MEVRVVGDGRTYWLGKYEVEIERLEGGKVYYRYLNPSATMKRDADGKVRGSAPWPGFASQCTAGRRG